MNNTKFTVEFHRVTCEKAFLEIEAHDLVEAENMAKKVTADDPRLEFEPMSSTIEIASIKNEP